jgi:20S proteasome subunit beta 7
LIYILSIWCNIFYIHLLWSVYLVLLLVQVAVEVVVPLLVSVVVEVVVPLLVSVVVLMLQVVVVLLVQLVVLALQVVVLALQVVVLLVQLVALMLHMTLLVLVRMRMLTLAQVPDPERDLRVTYLTCLVVLYVSMRFYRLDLRQHHIKSYNWYH